MSKAKTVKSVKNAVNVTDYQDNIKTYYINDGDIIELTYNKETNEVYMIVHQKVGFEKEGTMTLE